MEIGKPVDVGGAATAAKGRFAGTGGGKNSQIFPYFLSERLPDTSKLSDFPPARFFQALQPAANFSELHFLQAPVSRGSKFVQFFQSPL